MPGSLGMLLTLSLLGGYVWFKTQSVVATLNVIAWSFALYMVSKILLVIFQIPKVLRYVPPRTDVPHTVDREHLPVLVDKGFSPEERVVYDLVRTICTKIEHAADEAAIHSFVQAKLTTLRRKTHERYANISSRINVIGFEGIIGTLIGLITFMAQATILFEIPPVNGDIDTSVLVSKMIANISKIDLLTVSTAFLTSILGWGAKAWIGQWVDMKIHQETASITEVESWLQDQILSRVALPAQVTTILKLANLDELHGPLNKAVESMSSSSRGLDRSIQSSTVIVEAAGAALQQVEQLFAHMSPLMRSVANLETMRFKIKYVAGGIELIPCIDKSSDTKEV